MGWGEGAGGHASLPSDRPDTCTLHLLLRPALQLHPELLFSAAARPKVSPSLVPPAKRIISNDLAGGLAAAFSLRVLNLDYCRLLTQINNSQGQSQS